jgi:hypothetical protein
LLRKSSPKPSQRLAESIVLLTGLAVVAPAGRSHGHPGIPGRLDRLHDVEPAAIEKERVFAKQVVELWNQGMN